MLTMDDIQAIIDLIEKDRMNHQIAKKLKMSPAFVAEVRKEYRREQKGG